MISRCYRSGSIGVPGHYDTRRAPGSLIDTLAHRSEGTMMPSYQSGELFWDTTEAKAPRWILLLDGPAEAARPLPFPRRSPLPTSPTLNLAEGASAPRRDTRPSTAVGCFPPPGRSRTTAALYQPVLVCVPSVCHPKSPSLPGGRRVRLPPGRAVSLDCVTSTARRFAKQRFSPPCGVTRDKHCVTIKRQKKSSGAYRTIDLHLLYAPLTIPLVYCHINSFQRVCSVARP